MHMKRDWEKSSEKEGAVCAKALRRKEQLLRRPVGQWRGEGEGPVGQGRATEIRERLA